MVQEYIGDVHSGNNVSYKQRRNETERAQIIRRICRPRNVGEALLRSNEYRNIPNSKGGDYFNIIKGRDLKNNRDNQGYEVRTKL